MKNTSEKLAENKIENQTSNNPKKMEKLEMKMELLTLLFQRKITYLKFLEIAKEKDLNFQKSIEEEIRKVNGEKPMRKFGIRSIAKMNYLETVSFLKTMENKGISKKDLQSEFFNLWEEGRITGFDYRYLIEAMGERAPKEFLEKAKATGRYDL